MNRFPEHRTLAPELLQQSSHLPVPLEAPPQSAASSGSPGIGKRKRGRKPANESRASAIRARLVTWKQAPESQRVSLRALAAELGTSHQLLAFYLRGLDKWQSKEYRRKMEEISDRAKAENRLLSPLEQGQIARYGRASFQCMIDSVLESQLKKLAARVKAGRGLKPPEIRVLRLLAQKGGSSSPRNHETAPK